MQKWLDSPFGAQPPLSSAGDLLALLPRYRPTNYRLQKVKSHQDLAAVPLDELLPAIGNHVADVAAKGAEAADMPGLSEQLTAVANWYDEQEANLFTFFQYQLELTKAVGNLTNAAAHATADNQSGIADDNEILGQWCALQDSSQQFSGPPPGPADAMSRISRQTTWPPEFLQSLYAWCQQLQWPAAETSASPHTLAGITYLELFTNFVVCTVSAIIDYIAYESLVVAMENLSQSSLQTDVEKCLEILRYNGEMQYQYWADYCYQLSSQGSSMFASAMAKDTRRRFAFGIWMRIGDA
ncbi:hypothetical protein AK812_SmicGene7188 [Symbiodinium microadriaticum]|uniref:Uncharacterized protein n=1 Tax=Symbiodinium microadriaticum TaxID=2951 RepID=A0A1Q9EP67_SYMMI|nr:hypothetical protein AK812_SmicGene7188 [Symbiodinium microadriaticum]